MRIRIQDLGVRRWLWQLRLALPVVGDDFVRVFKMFLGEEDVPRVSDGKEMLGAARKCALVPTGLVDVYGRRELCSHFYLVKGNSDFKLKRTTVLTKMVQVLLGGKSLFCEH